MLNLPAIYKRDDGGHLNCHILQWIKSDGCTPTKAIISSDITGQLSDVYVSSLTLKNQPRIKA